MLRMFRKARKSYVVLITVMLLLPVQQSFSQTLMSETTVAVEKSTMRLEHCQSSNVTADSEVVTNQKNCCEDNSCDPGHCSFSISFLALFPDPDIDRSFDPQQHIVFIEQLEAPVLSSELFRPPKLQS